MNEVEKMWTVARDRAGSPTEPRTPSPAAVAVLMALFESDIDREPLTVSEIARAADVDQGSVSRILRKLDRFGFTKMTGEEHGFGGNGGGRPAQLWTFTFLGRHLARTILLDKLTFQNGVMVAARTPSMPLSDRELNVLHLAANGLTNARIGDALGLSEDTVKTHMKKIFRKMSAEDRAHAVHLGWQLGLIGNAPPENLPKPAEMAVAS